MRRLNRYFRKIIKNWFRKNEPEINPLKKYVGAIISKIELVEIGERVSFGGQVRIFNTEMVKIGHDCMIAFGVQFITATHDYSNHPMWKHRVDRPIEVGNHVWIGSNAIILPGVKIGNYAVIGAGTVVSAHVPERAIVVGNPARIINFRNLPEFDTTCVYPGVVVKKDFFPENKITKLK